MEHFFTYFKALQSYNFAEITEHSLRPELKDLLTGIAHEVDAKIEILHEGKREGKFGAPDFKVKSQEQKRLLDMWGIRRLERTSKIGGREL